jgi:hypothetical protein
MVGVRSKEMCDVRDALMLMDFQFIEPRRNHPLQVWQKVWREWPLSLAKMALESGKNGP